MQSVSVQNKKIIFRAVETPTAWLVVAVAWKVIDGETIYSKPKVVRIIPKPRVQLEGNSNKSCLALFGTSVYKIPRESVPSPYSFLYVPERNGSITWFGARPPTAKL